MGVPGSRSHRLLSPASLAQAWGPPPGRRTLWGAQEQGQESLGKRPVVSHEASQPWQACSAPEGQVHRLPAAPAHVRGGTVLGGLPMGLLLYLWEAWVRAGGARGQFILGCCGGTGPQEIQGHERIVRCFSDRTESLGGRRVPRQRLGWPKHRRPRLREGPPPVQDSSELPCREPRQPEGEGPGKSGWRGSVLLAWQPDGQRRAAAVSALTVGGLHPEGAGAGPGGPRPTVSGAGVSARGRRREAGLHAPGEKAEY